MPSVSMKVSWVPERWVLNKARARARAKAKARARAKAKAMQSKSKTNAKLLIPQRMLSNAFKKTFKEGAVILA